MLLHQHFKTAEGHTKHLSKLHRIDCVLFGMEHTRLILLYLFELVELGFIAACTMLLNVTLHFLVFNVRLGILLPTVVDLLVDQAVSLLEDLTDFTISSELDVHLHTDKILHDTDLDL